ncbi:MAG: acylphosphatase [Nitrospira sp.]
MMSPAIVRAHIWVSGGVQGVGYRAFTQRVAVQKGLCGGVRNLDDGRVEVDVEGSRPAIESLIKSLWMGTPMARVRNVQVQWETVISGEREFHILG